MSLVNAQGVHGLLMNAGNIAVVRSEAMKDLREQCDSNGVYIQAPKQNFMRGEKVRPTWGVFTGQVGIYDGVRAQQEVALFDLFGAKRRILFKEGNLVSAV
jgi:transcription antitermination factor NusG